MDHRETDAEGTVQDVEVTVTDKTKQILGIKATVVHDQLKEDGEVVEDTFDWYAQDVDGNLWYMGEDTKEFENGKVTSTEGSWEAGVDNAQPGIILPAAPAVGMTYRQEYLKGQAEDEASVMGLTEHVKVKFGTSDDVLIHPRRRPPGARRRRVQVLRARRRRGPGRRRLRRHEPRGSDVQTPLTWNGLAPPKQDEA
jgi:hypothetical protein